MSHLQPNTTLGGRYLIQEVIGKGGMGIVYRALDQEAGGHPCAVKVLRERHSSEKSKRRFDEEIRCVLKLKSPHIVKVFATGMTSPQLGARQYVVMELVNGVPLSELLRGEALGPERAVHVALGVASALEVAHREGVVHRDLKPANIIVGDLDMGGVVKILDFGIAKDLSREETLNLTRTGMLVGTPTYMSPERFQIDEPLTTAADLYSVGLLLYHMIHGRSPIYVKHPALPPEIKRLPAPLQVCWLHVNYEPPKLTQCPHELATLTQELLLKEPLSRPTASETLTRLNAALERHYNPDQEPITESLPHLLFDSVLAQYTPPPIERPPALHPSSSARRAAPIISSIDPAGPLPAQGRLPLTAPPLSSARLDASAARQAAPGAAKAPPVETLMLKPDDMAALNQELDQIVANLGGLDAPSAPMNTQRSSPDPLSASTYTAGASDARERHLMSTLRLDSKGQSLPGLSAIEAQQDRQQQTIDLPPPQAPLPQALSPHQPHSAQGSSLETEVELSLAQRGGLVRWLIPVISLIIGAALSYLLLTQR